jgi:hypothetical protein
MNTTIVYGLKQLDWNGTWFALPKRYEVLQDAINALTELRATREDLPAKVQSYDRSIIDGIAFETKRKTEGEA